MANVENSNTFFIDTVAADAVATTTGNLSGQNLRVAYIVVTATASPGILNLRDILTDVNKIELRVDTINTTERFNFAETPLVFPNGIHPETVTDCKATVVLKKTSQ